MKQTQTRRPAGAILICVLVCLGVATTMIMGSVRTSLRARRQIRHELQLEQTRMLVEAGLYRGIDRLRTDSEYDGETWRVTEAFATAGSATIEITVTDAAPTDDRKRLSVTARIEGPDAISKSTQRSRSWIVDKLTESETNSTK